MSPVIRWSGTVSQLSEDTEDHEIEQLLGLTVSVVNVSVSLNVYVPIQLLICIFQCSMKFIVFDLSFVSSSATYSYNLSDAQVSQDCISTSLLGAYQTLQYQVSSVPVFSLQ